MDDRHIRLRSYRLAFELERRIHRIDSFRIPLPYGMPLAALGWAAATLVLVLLAQRLPVIGGLLGRAPMPVRLLFIPGVVAHLLCRQTSDARPAHEALFARAAFLVRPKHRLGLAPVGRRGLDPAPVAVVPDERGTDYRSGTVAGPATVRLRLPAQLVVAHGRAVLHPQDAAPLLTAQDVCLRAGQRLVVV